MSGQRQREARAPHAGLDWPAEERDGRVELITGTVFDALEVPRAAGILAASWWRYSEGYPDEIRRLPALPDPRKAMAVIGAGDSYFFLAQAGECPWETQDPVTTAATASAGAVIRWHSKGSRIPAPPGPTGIGHGTGGNPADGASATWAHRPDRGIRLPSPAVLLHLLTPAVAVTRLGPQLLALDEGVLAIPVLGEPPTSAADGPATLPPPTPVTLAFSADLVPDHRARPADQSRDHDSSGGFRMSRTAQTLLPDAVARPEHSTA